MLTVDQQKPKKEVRFELAEEVEEASDKPEEEELLWWVLLRLSALNFKLNK